MASPQGEIYTGLQIGTHVDRWQAWLSEFSDGYIPQGYFPCTVCCFWTPFNVPSKIWLVMKACVTDVWLCTQRHGAHLTTTRLGNTLSRHCRDWNCKVLECLGFVSRLCVYSFRFDRILSLVSTFSLFSSDSPCSRPKESDEVQIFTWVWSVEYRRLNLQGYFLFRFGWLPEMYVVEILAAMNVEFERLT